ncbi:uncharacterized protein LTR77_011093 [Saxophila tyrrhenica]|uniref:BTB domain-containing protein n=1 Tax=Saxophila tyrrhenica TaxID=1690608 RepID=A0AAV9NX83_9PEZI|nr:hypothetical protein LTR77_011093 [Saxophila tyrrhenica]
MQPLLDVPVAQEHHDPHDFGQTIPIRVGQRREWYTRIVDLPDVTVATFEIYISWVYTGTLILHMDDEEISQEQDPDLTEQFIGRQYDQLINLYQLAVKLTDPTLRRIVLNRTLAFMATAKARRHAPATSEIEQIWPKMRSDDRMREELAGRLTEDLSLKEVEEHISYWPAPMKDAMLVMFFKTRDEGRGYSSNEEE